MRKLPSISGKQSVGALQKVGFIYKRQTGSHIVLRRDDPFSQIVVPNHDELDRGTLLVILRQADISVDNFIKML